MLAGAVATGFFGPVLSPLSGFAHSLAGAPEALPVGVGDQLLDFLLAHRLPLHLGMGQIDHDRSQRHDLGEQGLVVDNLLRFQPLEQLFPYPLAEVYATPEKPGLPSRRTLSRSILSTPCACVGSASVSPSRKLLSRIFNKLP